MPWTYAAEWVGCTKWFTLTSFMCWHCTHWTHHFALGIVVCGCISFPMYWHITSTCYTAFLWVFLLLWTNVMFGGQDIPLNIILFHYFIIRWWRIKVSTYHVLHYGIFTQCILFIYIIIIVNVVLWLFITLPSWFWCEWDNMDSWGQWYKACALELPGSNSSPCIKSLYLVNYFIK